MENSDNTRMGQPLPPELQQLDYDLEQYIVPVPTWRKIARAAGHITLEALSAAGRVYVPGVTPKWYDNDSDKR